MNQKSLKESLREYLETGVVQSPNTIYEKIYKLKPKTEIINISFKKNEIKKVSKLIGSLKILLMRKHLKMMNFLIYFLNQ